MQALKFLPSIRLCRYKFKPRLTVIFDDKFAIIQGVAPEGTLIGVKVLDAAGSGYTSDVIAGINYCADQSLSGGRSQVINLSLGGGEFSGNCDTDSTAKAANNAVGAGVVVVASSGNEAYANAMGSPTCGSKVIAVGAVYDDNFPNCEYDEDRFLWCGNASCTTILCSDTTIKKDDLICFSNRSTAIDVVAPGCVITSADNSGSTEVSGMCGTSQASPHVAGLAALLLSQAPELSPALVRQYIREGAVDDLFTPGFDSGYGHGRIDVIKSLSVLLGSGCGYDSDCDNGLYCDGDEICDAGVCQPGNPVACNDGVSCTDDSCDESTKSCDYVINDGKCNDGLFCNGKEYCDAAAGCKQGTDSCTIGEECNETADTCEAQICHVDGVCEFGENCQNCPSDCKSGTSGGTDPTVCTKGKTDGICHPKEIGTACPDCAVNYCCGDGVCDEGAENSASCLIDCPLPPSCEKTEDPETNCTDGKDNDCDGDIDTSDTDCEIPECSVKGDPCSSAGDCCSNKCVRGVCK